MAVRGPCGVASRSVAGAAADQARPGMMATSGGEAQRSSSGWRHGFRGSTNASCNPTVSHLRDGGLAFAIERDHAEGMVDDACAPRHLGSNGRAGVGGATAAGGSTAAAGARRQGTVRAVGRHPRPRPGREVSSPNQALLVVIGLRAVAPDGPWPRRWSDLAPQAQTRGGPSTPAGELSGGWIERPASIEAGSPSSRLVAGLRDLLGRGVLSARCSRSRALQLVQRWLGLA